MRTLKLRTISALQWSVAAQAATVSTGVALTVLLARLLSPRDFGLIGMIAVFTGFLSFFVDMGFGPAVIQKRDCTEEQVNAAFWANLLLGALITLALVLLAPAVALFYREPRLVPLVTALAFNYLLSSVYVIRNALLRKEMKFKDLARIEIGANLVSAFSALSLALTGFGVWSLVAQQLVLTLATALIGWDALSWRPSRPVSLAPLKGLLRFSTNMFGANVVNYWMRNADNMLIGRYIGAAALGIYSRAYTLMLLPLTQVTAILGRVMVPALSSIQHDRPRVKEACLHAMRNISLVTFPLMLGLFALADHFVLALLGPRWEGVIPLLRILCFVGLDHSIGATADWIYQSQGRTDVMFRWSAVATALYITSFIVGLRWGVAGVAWAYLICNYAVLWYPSWRVAGRLVGLRPSEVVLAVAPAFVAAVAMLVPVRFSLLLVPDGAPHALSLAVGTLTGMAAYAALIFAVNPSAYAELGELLARRGGGQASGPRAPGVVVHYKYGSFLPLTENWIYSQIRHAARFSPVVYCHSTENLDAYPVDELRALSAGKGFSPRALANRCCHRLFRFYPYFAWHLFRDRPALIHAHFGPSGCAILPLKQLFRVPLITAFYGYDLSQLPSADGRWRRRYRELFAAGECFLVEGNHMKARLRELGCPEDKVVVHHLGVDVEEIPYAPRRLTAPGTVRVLMSGTFKEKKGIPCGIEAFAALKKKHPRLDLRLTLLGGSRGLPDEEREKEKILSSIERLGVREFVSLEGFQPNEAFRRHLYGHHLFLSPSVTASSGDTEGGAPVSLIEASASGMPVLSTAHCDIPETVLDGESGYLVPERDTKALAEKLEALVLSPGTWEAMGARGRRHVEEEYDARKQAQKLEEIVAAVIRGPGR